MNNNKNESNISNNNKYIEYISYRCEIEFNKFLLKGYNNIIKLPKDPVERHNIVNQDYGNKYKVGTIFSKKRYAPLFAEPVAMQI